jgi:hypothetical protein
MDRGRNDKRAGSKRSFDEFRVDERRRFDLEILQCREYDDERRRWERGSGVIRGGVKPSLDSRRVPPTPRTVPRERRSGFAR